MAARKKSKKTPDIITIPEYVEAPSGLTNLALTHKTGTVMFFLGLFLIGTISFRFIPLSLFPETTYPGLTIETEYFGVGPEKIEEILTKPIEETVSTLGGIEQLFSTSEEGKSKVHIQFDPKVDLDAKSLEVRDKVEQISYLFPRETQKPVILHYDPTQKPAFIITPKSDSLNIMEIREISDREIKKLIEGISGVSEVIIAGGKPREILIACDAQKMSKYNIRMDLLLQILQESNYNDASGEIKEGSTQIPIYIKGRLRNLKQIESLALRSDASGKLIRISDVASVSYSYREESTAARLNGQNTVSIFVYRSGTANLLEVSSKLKKELKQAETENLHFDITYDQADTIVGAIKNFILAALIGIIFYLIFSAIFFQEILTAIVNVTLLIFQFFIVSIFLYFLDIDYNLVTIVGIILSTGCGFTVFIASRLFIQNKHFFSGINFIKKEIFTTILLVLGIFLPISFATKELRTLYGGLGLVLVLGFFISFLVSLTLIPILEIYLAKKIKFIFRIQIFTDYFQKINRNITAKTIFLLEEVRTKPKLFLFFYMSICFFGVITYIYSNHEFVNKIEEKQLIGNVEFPSGTSFSRINSTTERIENKLSTLASIKEVNSRVEIGRSTIVVKFHDSITDAEEIGKELEEFIGDIKPAFIYFAGSNDEALLKEITIDVIGDDLQKLDEITREASSAAQNLIPNVRHVLLRYKPPRDEVRIILDKSKSESLGITSEEIGKLVRYGVQGGVATKFIEEGREVDVRIQYNSEFRNSFADVRDYRITTQDGRSVPLMEVATIARDTTPVRIYRKNKRRVLSFSLRVSNLSLSEILAKLDKLKKVKLPDQYRIEFSEHLEKVISNQKKMNSILSFSALILFMILASYLESLRKPILLLSALPIPLTIIISSLFIMDLPITISVYIGMILISTFALFETFIFSKELSYWKNELEFKETKKLPKNIQELISKLIGNFFQLWLLVGIFYAPQVFIFGTGSAMLKTISITIVLGLISLSFFVPFIFLSFYLYSKTFNKVIITNFDRIRLFILQRIIPKLRRKNG
ncbi:efflux RND transporter permease subunit [Leptospira sp. 201903070]|uniref:Efflux RND transporter permease subunit n=1 Tax=Leptospira ainlahdjerensis TaxID=2810033 RepID=A0ABS2U7L7_9LEPT|nr:efflux RND transporter permease subunit [Leptospira ainlahdjerensis]MBM9576363.1 efflux RND transporter permease subunit [Leptospira ainlahdjerensis]